jgi:hypothetical protein
VGGVSLLVKTKHELPIMCKATKTRAPIKDILNFETKVPAVQAEQVEDDVAPMTAEYVPAQVSDEGYWKSIRRAEVFDD